MSRWENRLLIAIAILGGFVWLFDEFLFLAGKYFPGRMALGFFSRECQEFSGGEREQVAQSFAAFLDGNLCDWEAAMIFDIGAMGAVVGILALWLRYRLRSGNWFW